MRLNPYLSFRDNAREALSFYQSIFGGETSINTFAEFNASDEPDEQDLVMHGQLESPHRIVLMMADTPKRMEYTPGGSISVSINGTEESELTSYWEKLSDGGTIVMPMEAPEWGGKFGMLVDRYGVTWMVSIDDE